MLVRVSIATTSRGPGCALRRALLLAALVMGCAVALLTSPAWAAPDDETTRLLLAAGDKALGSGRSHYPEALAKYTEALVRSPESDRGLYSRAELLSSMNSRKAALVDLNALLTVSPRHPQGLALRMALNAQEGRLDAAVEDGRRLSAAYMAAARPDKARETDAAIRELKQYWAAWRRLSDVMDAPVASLAPAGSNAALRHRYAECITLLQSVIRAYAPDSVDLRLRRASCALASGDSRVAQQEVKYVLTRESQNLLATALNAKAMRGIGALDQARSEVRRCLSNDPEYAPCAVVSKLIRGQQRHVAAIEAGLAGKNYEAVAAEIDAAFSDEDGTPPYSEQLLRWRCEALAGLRDAHRGVPACEAAIATAGPDSPLAEDLHARIVDLHIADDNLDKAEAVAKEMGQAHPHSGRVNELLHKIQTLRRTGARKDYYAILGVKKSASASEIRKAYRKLAKTMHPDLLLSKNMTDAEREKSDKRFRDVNEAKEVLLDEDKRKRYDNGEDVMNPNAQASQQGGPFYGQQFHGNPFGGGNPFANAFRGGGGGGRNFRQGGGGGGARHFQFF